ncbi:DUF421 domain-containing protein [Cesiribacter sp. SM1]|uniref:DUF421 domain-containing protein n=1 Tax=Cesiribacter sp. SM1 TaxID=2861196 RepID=UPI001CD76311|nr:YetF domain-containing protein [Cesiribacter sp. SM1]
MKETDPFSFDGEMVIWGLASASLVFILVIGLTRLFGLRSFARLSTFDFAFTLAKGALIASIALNDDIGFFEGAVALLTIYLFEWATASLRNRFELVNKLVSNKPVLLMYKGEYLMKNINSTRVSLDDIHFAMRQANVQQFGEVKAVIAEPTGQISVLTGEPATVEKLLEGVVR